MLQALPLNGITFILTFLHYQTEAEEEEEEEGLGLAGRLLRPV